MQHDKKRIRKVYSSGSLIIEYDRSAEIGQRRIVKLMDFCTVSAQKSFYFIFVFVIRQRTEEINVVPESERRTADKAVTVPFEHNVALGDFQSIIAEGRERRNYARVGGDGEILSDKRRAARVALLYVYYLLCFRVL